MSVMILLMAVVELFSTISRQQGLVEVAAGYRTFTTLSFLPRRERDLTAMFGNSAARNHVDEHRRSEITHTSSDLARCLDVKMPFLRQRVLAVQIKLSYFLSPVVTPNISDRLRVPQLAG